MLFSKFKTSDNTSKDANTFAPSCSSADKNSNIVNLAGIAFAVSVFLFILRLDILCNVLLLNVLILIGRSLLRKKQFVG